MKKILKRVKSNQGSMLILTLITITVIIVLGVSALNVATTETKITKNEQDRINALNYAEAGIDHFISNPTSSIGQTSFGGGRGNYYQVTKNTTTDPYQYNIVAIGTSNGFSKKISTIFTVIRNLTDVIGPILADNLIIDRDSFNTYEDAKIKTEDLPSEIGVIAVNSSILINSTDEDKIEIEKTVIKLAPNVDKNKVPESYKTKKIEGDQYLIQDMTLKAPIPQIDIEYYRNKIPKENIYNGGTYYLNDINYTMVDGYRVYFVEGNLIINQEFKHHKAIIIATDNVTINAKTGYDDNRVGGEHNPVIIYGNHVTINGNNMIENHNKDGEYGDVHYDDYYKEPDGKLKIEGILIAKNDITLTNLANIKGALIAPNVSITGSKWQLEYEHDIFTNQLVRDVKILQNKKVATWKEE